MHQWYADDAAEKQPQVLRFGRRGDLRSTTAVTKTCPGDLDSAPAPYDAAVGLGSWFPMSENPDMGHPWSCGLKLPCKAGPSTSPSLRSGFSRNGIVLSNPCDGDKSQGWGTEFRRDGGDVKSDSSGAEALRLCDAFQGPEGPCSLRECRPTWDRAFPPLATETGRKDGARRRFAD